MTSWASKTFCLLIISSTYKHSSGILDSALLKGHPLVTNKYVNITVAHPLLVIVVSHEEQIGIQATHSLSTQSGRVVPQGRVDGGHEQTGDLWSHSVLGAERVVAHAVLYEAFKQRYVQVEIFRQFVFSG